MCIILHAITGSLKSGSLFPFVCKHYRCCRKKLQLEQCKHYWFTIVLVPTILYPVILPVYGNVDIKVHKSNSISKAMFAAHVNAMHRNRDEGFEREFEVSV